VALEPVVLWIPGSSGPIRTDPLRVAAHEFPSASCQAAG